MLKSLGEFGFIRRLKARQRRSRTARVAIGDDTAVLRPAPRGIEQLFTTDMLIEGRHFIRAKATAYEIGYKAMAVNLSDIAAMGGVPAHAVVAAGLPGNLSVHFLDELYRGLNDCARAWGAEIVGGDTNRSDRIILSVAMTGYVEKGRAILRSGAKPGDILFVSGELGGSYVSKKHLRFVPRLREARYLLKNFGPRAMMDISDGLASDLRRIAQASGVGVLIDESALPVSGSAQGTRAALCDGEDFELLFALSPEKAVKLALARHPKGLAPFSAIGKVVEKRRGLMLMSADGRLRRLVLGGYDHYR